LEPRREPGVRYRLIYLYSLRKESVFRREGRVRGRFATRLGGREIGRRGVTGGDGADRAGYFGPEGKGKGEKRR